MGNSTHTPGPWTIQPAKTGDTFAMIRAALPGYSGTRKIAEVTDVGAAGEANARLIAAAPELLAALRAYDAAVGAGIDSDPEMWAKAARLTAAAIAKATAEQKA